MTSSRTQTPEITTFGVDVSKDSLSIAQGQMVREIANTRVAIRSWLKHLAPGTRLAVEATGSYHQLLCDLAYMAGCMVYVLNPKDARHYRFAVGGRAKTDRTDARLIARYVEREHSELRPYVPSSPQQRRLVALLRRRNKLVQAKGRIRQSLQGLSGFDRDIKALFSRLDALVDKMEQQMADLIAQCPEQQQLHQRLSGIVGVGELTANALVAVLSSGDFQHGDALVAYAGLDPRAHESGQKIGKRKLSKKGDPLLRRLLYTAAMGASRSALWKPFCQRYKDRGLAGTQVLNILARKLLRVVWALYKSHGTFCPERLFST
jgi:transposase